MGEGDCVCVGGRGGGGRLGTVEHSPQYVGSASLTLHATDAETTSGCSLELVLDDMQCAVLATCTERWPRLC